MQILILVINFLLILSCKESQNLPIQQNKQDTVEHPIRVEDVSTLYVFINPKSLNLTNKEQNKVDPAVLGISIAIGALASVGIGYYAAKKFRTPTKKIESLDLETPAPKSPLDSSGTPSSTVGSSTKNASPPTSPSSASKIATPSQPASLATRKDPQIQAKMDVNGKVKYQVKRSFLDKTDPNPDQLLDVRAIKSPTEIDLSSNTKIHVAFTKDSPPDFLRQASSQSEFNIKIENIEFEVRVGRAEDGVQFIEMQKVLKSAGDLKPIDQAASATPVSTPVGVHKFLDLQSDERMLFSGLIASGRENMIKAAKANIATVENHSSPDLFFKVKFAAMQNLQLVELADNFPPKAAIKIKGSDYMSTSTFDQGGTKASILYLKNSSHQMTPHLVYKSSDRKWRISPAGNRFKNGASIDEANDPVVSRSVSAMLDDPALKATSEERTTKNLSDFFSLRGVQDEKLAQTAYRKILEDKGFLDVLE